MSAGATSWLPPAPLPALPLPLPRPAPRRAEGRSQVGWPISCHCPPSTPPSSVLLHLLLAAAYGGSPTLRMHGKQSSHQGGWPIPTEWHRITRRRLSCSAQIPESRNVPRLPATARCGGRTAAISRHSDLGS